jgi:peroxiredoxin Q/BCP
MLDTAGVRLQVGDQVPDFSYASEAFGSVSAASLRGKRYVMYFYPKDDTPGCTREACAFRDNLPRFAGIGVKVFGVSADDEKSHLRFARKHALPFKLIPDPDHVICEAFGTWIEKNMYGRSYMGVARSTFVIGPDGKIEKIWEKVAPDGHAEEVFAWLNGDPIPVPAKPAPLPKPVAPPTRPVVSATPKAPAKPVAQASAVAPKPAPASKTALPEKPAAKPAPAKPAAKKAAPAKPAARKPAPTKAARPARPVAKKVSAKKSAKPVARTAASKKVARVPAVKKPAAGKAAARPTAKKAPIKKAPIKKAAMKAPARKPAAKKAKARR